MKGGGVVQPHPLAQVCKADAFTVARDFLQNGEGPTERLDAHALPIIFVAVGSHSAAPPGDFGLVERNVFRGRRCFCFRSCLHQSVSRRAAWRTWHEYHRLFQNGKCQLTISNTVDLADARPMRNEARNGTSNDD